jgi:hypothetical protein
MEKKNIFKENWLKTDECCEKCGQVTKAQKGLTKQNLKRLFTIKFNMNELIFTVIIILVLVSAYAYREDTKTCREYVKQVEFSFLNLSGGSYTIPDKTNTTTNTDYDFTITTEEK